MVCGVIADGSVVEVEMHTVDSRTSLGPVPLDLVVDLEINSEVYLCPTKLLPKLGHHFWVHTLLSQLYKLPRPLRHWAIPARELLLFAKHWWAHLSFCARWRVPSYFVLPW